MSIPAKTVALLVLAIAGCTDEAELGTASSDLSGFVLPSLSTDERTTIVHKYDQLDPTDAIPRGLLEDAVVYYDVNLPLIPKTKYLVVVDLSKYSGKNRYWLVDTASGTVEAHKVAHGDGSDPDNNGYATTFGNVDGSHKSSLGFYLTGEIYDGTHPHSMRLDGLSPDGSPNGMANSNVRSRLIVMHQATYVADGNASQQGRSNGCLALDPAIEVGMVDRIHDGTLIYVATSSLAPPVGRTPPTMPPTMDPPADDPDTHGVPGDDPPANGELGGGCSTTGGGAGALLGLALVGLRRRRA